MPSTVLHVADILAWADEHHKRTGKFPSKESGDVVAAAGEKWKYVDQALRRGDRGLPGKWSLAQLLADYRGHRNRSRLPRYTLKSILRWADAHKKRTGSWPRMEDGAIHEAPGETWKAVQMAMLQGRRGLPGGSSLAQLLAKHRKVRNQTSIPRLSSARILRWADAHQKRTGNWPTAASGPIPESPGDTWSAINLALWEGLRGLRKGFSLSKLLAKFRGVRRHIRRAPLTVKQILEWAEAHQRRTGRWPNETSGVIAEVQGQTWLRIQVALKEGRYGLPKGWTLGKLWEKHHNVVHNRHCPKLSLRQIRHWAREYYRRHGRPPHYQSGVIPKTNGETWWRVNTALKQGRRGLPGGLSLAQLIEMMRPSLPVSPAKQLPVPRSEK